MLWLLCFPSVITIQFWTSFYFLHSDFETKSLSFSPYVTTLKVAIKQLRQWKLGMFSMNSSLWTVRILHICKMEQKLICATESTNFLFDPYLYVIQGRIILISGKLSHSVVMCACQGKIMLACIKNNFQD